jgi:hypothetical protein
MPTVRLQIRRKEKQTWADLNTVLLEGELGLESDTGLVKIGYGSKNWNDLPYINKPIDKIMLKEMLNLQDLIETDLGEQGFLQSSGLWKSLDIGDVNDLAVQLAEKADLNHKHVVKKWLEAEQTCYAVHGDQFIATKNDIHLNLVKPKALGEYVELIIIPDASVTISSEHYFIVRKEEPLSTNKFVLLNTPGKYHVIFSGHI